MKTAYEENNRRVWMSENGWMGIEFLDSQIEMPTVIHEFGQSAVDDENWGSCWVTFPEGEK